jgi:two-component system chemotaxis response regulator CheB
VSGSVHIASRIDVVVVAGSAGTVPIYADVFGRLDGGLPVPVVLLQHRAPGPDLVLELLRRRTRLTVRVPGSGERLLAGSLYVAPRDVRLRFAAPSEVMLAPIAARPSADIALTSAAATYGGGVLAVVLSGRLEDGAAGARAVKQAGGRVIVQDPNTTRRRSMPAAVLATGCVDACLPPTSIADAIEAFVTVPGAAGLFSTRAAPWAWTVSN